MAAARPRPRTGMAGRGDGEGLNRLIHDMGSAGGAVFRREHSVIGRRARAGSASAARAAT